MQKTGLISKWVGFLKRQETPFKVNILKNLAQRFATYLTFDYQSIYVLRLGASPLLLGYISSISGLANTLISIPSGIIADRFGIKKVLLMIITISTLAAFFFGASTSWQIAAIGLILSAMAITLNGTLCPMICGSTLASDERITGIGICDTISFFPKLTAPIIAAFLITLFGGMNVQGIRPLFYFQIIGLAIAFLIIYTRFENPSALKVESRETSIFSDFRKMILEGTMVGRWLLIVFISSFPRQVLFYIPLFAAEIKGADQFIIGGMGAASTLVLVFLAVILGHLADSYGRKKVISVTSGFVCLSYLLLIYSPNNIILLLSAFFNGFLTTIAQSHMAIGADLVPKKYLGSWFGVVGFSKGLIGIVSPIICGLLWDIVSPQSVFFLLIIMQLISLGVLLTVPTSITK